MAREKGIIGLSVNFEPGGATPLDSRLVVATKSELTSATTYPDNNVYVGMVVAVTSGTDSGLYLLKATPYTVESNWEKIGADGGGTATAPTYTAGENILISESNVISAKNTTYTAGENIQISERNVISATAPTYTAGENIQISASNVISAILGDNDAIFEPTLADTQKVPTAVGGIAKDTTVASLRGMTLSQLLQNMLFPAINPTATVGGLSMAVSGFVNGNAYEVGTAVPTTSAMSSTLNQGKWKVVNQADRNYYGSGSNKKFYKKINGVGTDNTTQWGSTLTVGTHYFYGTINVAQGDMPVNSLGEAVQSLRVQAQTLTSPDFVIYAVYPFYTNGYNIGTAEKENTTVYNQPSSADARTKIIVKPIEGGNFEVAVKFASEASTNVRAEFWYASERQLQYVRVWSAFDKGYINLPSSAYIATADTATINGVQYKKFITTGSLQGSLQLKFILS